MDPGLLNLITGGTGALGVLVIFVILILNDKLHPDGEFQRVLGALEVEKKAHDETRKALGEASARADAAVKASELIASAMSGETRRRRSDDIP